MAEKRGGCDMSNGKPTAANPPREIFLQVEEEDDGTDLGGTTWCVDQINETDIRYVRAAPASDAAQPVAWAWITVDRVTGFERRHTSFSRPCRDAYTKDVRALVYAHPDISPDRHDIGHDKQGVRP